MLRITVSTAEAVITETELITSGRKGLKCAFTFSSDWSGLQKTAVLQSVVKRDIALLNGNEVTVPAECLAKANFPLKIGVYGARPDGTIAIPTIWANFGKIQPGTLPSLIPPDELTPDVVAQIQEAASNALYLARNVQSMADAGAFDGEDGVSPSLSSSAITGGHRVSMTDKDGTTTFDVMDGQDGRDGNSFWTSPNAPTTPNYTFTIADLIGPTGATPEVGDMVYYGYYRYTISSVSTTTVLTGNRQSLRGSSGSNGVGVPTGGSTGQVLKKASGTDYDTEWANESGGGGSVSPYTSNPAALGTASPGSSDDYARGDHVHDYPQDFKDALLQLAAKVAYIDSGGATYYKDLYNALNHVVSYTVTNTLSHCTSSNDAIVATSGSSYSATITAASGYTLTGATVSVTMGGDDITSTAYSNGTISIDSVSGSIAISITAAVAAVTYSVTNELTHCSNSNSSATATSGTSYTGTITADAGYAIQDSDIIVRMNGEVLSGVVSSGVVTIANVTGDIRITAVAASTGYTAFDAIWANSNYTYNAENSIFFPDYVANGDVVSLDDLQLEFEMQAQSSQLTQTGTTCLIGAKDATSSSDINGLQINIKGGEVFAYAHKINTYTNSAAVLNVSDLEKHIIMYTNNGVSPFILSIDSTDHSVAWTSSQGYTSKLGLSFCNTNGTPGSEVKNSRAKIGYVKIWDKNGTLLNHFVPAKRNADNFIGMYDSAKDVFITATTNTRYAVGSWTVVS